MAYGIIEDGGGIETRQPRGLAGLSSLGIESGIISLCYPTETGLLDAARGVLTTKTIWYTGGLSLGAGPAGRAIVGSSGGDDVYVVGASPIDAPWTSLARASGTVFALIRRIGNAAGNAPIFGVLHPSHSPYATLMLYDAGGSGNIALDGSPGGSYTNFASSAMTNGALEFWVGTYDGAAGRLYKNGVLQATSGAVSGALAVSSQFDACAMNFGQGALNRTFNGEFYLGGISPLGWSPSFVSEVSRNPWRLVEPINEPVFYSLSGGSATTVAVPAGALTLTGYAPTVTAGGTASTSVPAGAVTLTAYAPTVTAGGTASTSVPLGTVTLTGYAPTVTVGGAASIDVPLGTVALTGYAPTVTTGGQAQIDVPLGTVTLTGYVPTVTTTEHVYIAVPTAAMTLAAYVPTVTTSGTPDTWTPVSASAGTWTPQ